MKSRLRLANACCCGSPRRVDFGKPHRKTIRRFRNQPIGIHRTFGKRGDLLTQLRCLASGLASDGTKLLGDRSRRFLGSRKVLEQHSHIVARGFGCAIESFAMSFQPLGAGVELARDVAELAGRVVSELHQVLGDHGQLDAAVLNPLGQDLEQSFE